MKGVGVFANGVVMAAKAVAIIFSSMIVLSNAVLSANETFDSDLQREWLDWCFGVKEELRDLRVFDAKASHASAEPEADGVRFIEFESLRIPYIVDETPSISVKRGLEGGPWLRISYDSSLRILATAKMRHPVTNVFENLVPELPEGIEAYIVERYGSLEGFTSDAFGGVPDFFHLRFEGHKFTTEDIDCDASIEDTLWQIPSILASGSADYAAIRAGEDVAYWSNNKMPGVVTRQQTQFSTGNLGPRILWSGEFIAVDEIWQVIVSFDVENQDRYDRLGGLLANPGSE